MKTKRPPLVAGLPLIGSAFTIFGGNAKDFLVSQYKNYGPVFRIRALHLDYVVMAGPSANKFINGEGRDSFQSKSYWQGMMQQGVYVNLAVPPATPNGLNLMRCSLSAAHSFDQIDYMLEKFIAVGNELGVVG